MSDNYATIVENNHKKLYMEIPPDFEERLNCTQSGNSFIFSAFGDKCTINDNGFFLGGEKQTGVTGILLSLYALHAVSEACINEPYKAYKDFPDTMPYIGAFTTHTENILIPYVDQIKDSKNRIIQHLNGEASPHTVSGDFSFVVFPLPKIALCYIFYEADEDFPASVTCLYSNNASNFLPNDALADVGEYTSKKIIQIVTDK